MKLFSSLVVVGALVAGCRSPASHYYTLVAPPSDAVPGTPSTAFQIDVLPVDVPPEVDRAQMVVRRGTGEVVPVDTRSWIAPLPLELRRALADELIHVLGARDVAGVSPTAGVPVYRIKLSVVRFESLLAERVLIDGTWSIRETAGTTPPLTCSSRATEAATGEYAGLAEAHQRALARVAAEIAAAVRSMQAGAPACPGAAAAK